jgi:hypothetical protein
MAVGAPVAVVDCSRKNGQQNRLVGKERAHTVMPLVVNCATGLPTSVEFETIVVGPLDPEPVDPPAVVFADVDPPVDPPVNPPDDPVLDDPLPPLVVAT